jgi:flagellar protein FlaJ
MDTGKMLKALKALDGFKGEGAEGIGYPSNDTAGKKAGGKPEMSKEMKALVVTVAISAVLFLIGFVSSNLAVMANVILISTFVIAVPQFLFFYEKYRNIKEMEEKFPVFLRDIIESLSAGLPLHKAVISSSKVDYGRLSEEIRKMSNQLSWGLPLQKVLDQFADRVRSSKRMFTSIKIINESYQSGGDVVSILSTVADHSNLLEDAERERKALLNQYVVLMYAISILFIVIVVAINKLMLPIFQTTSATSEVSQALGMSNPCDACYGFDCTVCKFYEAASVHMFSIDPNSVASYYISLFFFMSVVQAIFSGLVAGQIGENSLTAGIKHSLILVSITVVAFYLLIYFKLLGV